MADSSSQPELLIVEDDPRLLSFLSEELRCEGYAVHQAADGQAALMHLRQQPVDLVLLDWVLPDFSGVEVCRRIRSGGSTTPVLMLTGRDEVKDRVEALDSGADDFVLKPFSLEELLARVRAHIRRAGYQSASADDEILRYADLEMNTATREVSRGGEPIALSVREFDLLHCLMAQPERVLERQTILSRVWGEHHYGDSNLLDVYIRYLRKKIERPERPSLIQTSRGVGFMLKEAALSP